MVEWQAVPSMMTTENKCATNYGRLLIIQSFKQDKARAKNIDAANAIMTRCGGAVWCGNDRKRHLPQTAALQQCVDGVYVRSNLL
jgi:hypothetical protein